MHDNKNIKLTFIKLKYFVSDIADVGHNRFSELHAKLFETNKNYHAFSPTQPII